MAIATTATIRTVSGFDEAAATKVADHLPEAVLEAKRLLTTSRSSAAATGSEVTGGVTYTSILDRITVRYDEIVALGSSDQHYIALQRAEALLAVYFALPYLNMRVTEKGGLARAIGLAEGVNDLMSNQELEAYRRSIYVLAHEALRMLVRDTDASEYIPYTL